MRRCCVFLVDGSGEELEVDVVAITDGKGDNRITIVTHIIQHDNKILRIALTLSLTIIICAKARMSNNLKKVG